MLYRRAYRYRCYPTPNQAATLARTFGAARFVYNWGLRLRTDVYRRQHERLDYARTSAALTKMKQQPQKKGSRNREKARRKVARIHAQIADQRLDGLHQLTTRLIRENQTICVESLAVKNMVRNHKLARGISDAAWGEFVRQLTYKAQWYGRTLVKIDRWYPSSKRCHACEHTLDAIPLDMRIWTCPSCGMIHDRDVNAAKNILAVGLTVSACGETVRPVTASARAGATQ